MKTPQAWVSIALFMMIAGAPQALAADASPPGAPESGYGSSDAYISDGYTVFEDGSARRGTRVWGYVPDTLKDGASAPVVVYLHGWTAMLPEIYLGQIEHLLSQGYVVIYPQYQRSGAIGILTDSDQTKFIDRAISGTESMLRDLSDVADRRQLYVAGHSLGGLLAYVWNGAGGAPARGVLLLNASLSSDTVPDEVPLIPIDWEAYAEDIRVPLSILTGEDDGLYPDSLLGYEAAINAPSKAVFMATTDRYGSPPILASHGAPVAGSGQADTLDYRYYFAALDSMLGGDEVTGFDMGYWSDGTAVLEVQQLAP